MTSLTSRNKDASAVLNQSTSRKAAQLGPDLKATFDIALIGSNEVIGYRTQLSVM
jgi:hypothetical protein